MSADNPHKATLERKPQQKLALQESLNWPKEARQPLVCLPLGMTEALGGELLKEVLPGLLSQSIGILILGKGSPEYGAYFTELAKEEAHRVAIIPNKPEEMERMLAAADIALFLTEPNPADLKICMTNAVVPITLPNSYTEDYNPVQESGNSFTFQKPNPWHVFACLVRALETFKLPYDWRTIQRHDLETAAGMG